MVKNTPAIKYHIGPKHHCEVIHWPDEVPFLEDGELLPGDIQELIFHVFWDPMAAKIVQLAMDASSRASGVAIRWNWTMDRLGYSHVSNRTQADERKWGLAPILVAEPPKRAKRGSSGE